MGVNLMRAFRYHEINHLKRLEDGWRGLEDAIDAVGDVEAVRPVVVGHLAVVLLHRDDEADEGLVVEALQPEEVDEHEERLPHLVHVVHAQRVEREAEKFLVSVCSKIFSCHLMTDNCVWIYKKVTVHSVLNLSMQYGPGSNQGYSER